MDDEPNPVRVVYPLDRVRRQSGPVFNGCLMGFAAGVLVTPGAVALESAVERLARVHKLLSRSA